MRLTTFLFIFGFLYTSCQQEATTSDTEMVETPAVAEAALSYPEESNFTNLRQLTFRGDNAEAYFSFNDKYLVFQANNADWGTSCDQIFYMPTTGTKDAQPPLLSTGKGRTTCSYFMPGDSTILYASTHMGADTCPEAPRSLNGKYVWGIFPDFDIFVSDMKGNILKQLTDEPGYDAEATISPDGTKIVFTSTRSGDLELWTMDIDGGNVKQVTSGLGYDGGAFFSPDGSKLVFRASRPKTAEEVSTYKELLAQGLVQPTAMEIYVCDVDGSNLKQITDLGGANWAPYFHPSGNKIVFSTNHHTESGRQFNIFSINLDGSDLKQITFDPVFDAFPMFSYDGKKLVFSSNRNNGGTRDTNVFLADWQD
ncbi:MAG: PD40 domain-containing protein [Saprospiraceae bacterium]|nr:PD40 domain-containing protein [Saprospiraceae bacterium]